MASRSIFVLSAVISVASLATAQMRGGMHGPSRTSGAFSASFVSRHHTRSAVPRGYFLGDTPFLYSDYPFEPATPEPSSPQIIVAQPTPDPTPVAKATPLLIELQGDRYVRYGGVAQSADRQPSIAPVSGAAQDTTPSREFLPSVLIYRDGHREEIPDYAIVGGVIYAHKGIAGEGESGMNRIQVSALDVPATIKANRDQGVKFTLPAGPNEVITRP